MRSKPACFKERGARWSGFRGRTSGVAAGAGIRREPHQGAIARRGLGDCRADVSLRAFGQVGHGGDGAACSIASASRRTGICPTCVSQCAGQQGPGGKCCARSFRLFPRATPRPAALGRSLRVWVGNFDGSAVRGISGSEHAGSLLSELFRTLEGDSGAWRKPRGLRLDSVALRAVSRDLRGDHCDATIQAEHLPV